MRNGKPLAGLIFYDKSDRIMLKVGKENFNKKLVTLDEDERIIGFKSGGAYSGCPASHLNF